jgi:Icc-related predicted phosphoesterase
MKIFATSDLHGILYDLDPSGADVVVIAGDFAKLNRLDMLGFHDQKKWVDERFIPWTQKYTEIEFVVVPGNHDVIFDRAKAGLFPEMNFNVKFPKNVHLLLNEGIEIQGVSFYGTPNIPIINYRWAFESNGKTMKDSFSKIPENVDVLVTHSPPRIQGKFIDTSLQWGGTEFFGSYELADAILEKSPRFVFCGHIHSGSHEPCEFGKSMIYNVARVDENYEIAYPPVVVEV